MIISYNWLCEYLQVKPVPEKLSEILTSIGLEVEGMERYESVKGGLKGLVTGEVVECSRHPDAEKLNLTKVFVGGPHLLDIVCGAPNVAQGQKVIVAMIGTTIYPLKGDPLTIRLAKIRGAQSQGMLCAEDEIGLGESHAGIVVLPADSPVGMQVSDLIKPYDDFIITIGLTPNRMDAMSHLGVARDICAYLSHHGQGEVSVRYPTVDAFSVDNNILPISVRIDDHVGCQRFSGLSICGITIQPSPEWIQQKLKAIGIRPINNIVDITNFVLQETGQPLHAYDAGKISGHAIVVKRLPEGTPFVTLDGKERKLTSDDIMVCSATEGICIAGVFGGLTSGVGETTKDIFLESAWFNPNEIRKTSYVHGLRTEAALHFEKGVDIFQTTYALKRAALLIKTYAGGEISSPIIDVYPEPRAKPQISLTFEYLQRISGKWYEPATARQILTALGFELLKETKTDILVAVPFHKGDVTLPADLAEEIMRIDGYDNIPIPASIRISPAIEADYGGAAYQEKIAGYLVGQGFQEIFTNSITNSAFFNEQELAGAVRMINNLTAELNVMRPTLLHSGLESVAHNINRKNADLRFFEFGKSYYQEGEGRYLEINHLCLYVTGKLSEDSWRLKGDQADLFYLKGLAANLCQLMGVQGLAFKPAKSAWLGDHLEAAANGLNLMELGKVQPSVLKLFDIKQPVYFADLLWDRLQDLSRTQRIEFQELPRQLPVYRDLALVLDKSIRFEALEQTLRELKITKLQQVRLFDVFESDKLGAGKKSLAINLTFVDQEKTMTDNEIDGMVGRMIKAFEEKLGAEIRK